MKVQMAQTRENRGFAREINGDSSGEVYFVAENQAIALM
jgi:hypothetical protein